MAPKASDVRAAWNVYRTLCPPEELRWVKTTHMFFWDESEQLKEKDALEPYLIHQDDRRDIGVMVRNDQVEGGWAFTMRGMFPRDLGVERCASLCRIVFPVEVTPETVFEMAVQLANSLDFLSGHAGYSVDYDGGRAGTAFDHIYVWARRYYGIDVVDLRKTLPCVLDGIKGAGWITLVGNDLWNRLKVKIGHEPTFNVPISVLSSKYGVAVRAGSSATLGDRNRHDFPRAYAEVEKTLQPLKIKEHPSFLGMFQDEGVTEAWLRRFLEPEKW